MSTTNETNITLDSTGKISRDYLLELFYRIQAETSARLEAAGEKAAATDVRFGWPVLNGRLKKVAGRATCLKGQPGFGKIEISTKIFSHHSVSEQQLAETITHELAHLAAGYRAGHGSEWVRLFKLMGGNGEQFHDMTEAAEANRIPRQGFAIECRSCGDIIGIVTRRGLGQANRWANRRRSKCCGYYLTMHPQPIED